MEPLYGVSGNANWVSHWKRVWWTLKAQSYYMIRGGCPGDLTTKTCAQMLVEMLCTRENSGNAPNARELVKG